MKMKWMRTDFAARKVATAAIAAGVIFAATAAFAVPAMASETGSPYFYELSESLDQLLAEENESVEETSADTVTAESEAKDSVGDETETVADGEETADSEAGETGEIDLSGLDLSQIPGIDASLFTDIYSVNLADDDRRTDISDRISYGANDQKLCYITCHLCSPLRSFQTNLIEVPSKSKCSLILFSIYLEYEKCINSLSLMLKENSGGHVPIWVA